MNETTTKIPKSFYWISGIALVWNILGVVAYVMQMTMSPETLAAMPPEQQAIYNEMPAAIDGAFAIAVNGGAVGCVLLLMRLKIALYVFILSMAGIVVQFGYVIFLTETVAVMGATSVIGPIFVALVGIFLIWFTLSSDKKGLLK